MDDLTSRFTNIQLVSIGMECPVVGGFNKKCCQLFAGTRRIEMGRQIAIAATPVDEVSFLDFVGQKATIRVAESFAPSIDALWVNAFSGQLDGHRQYYIWNTAFSWEPQYAQVMPDARDLRGWYYISNAASAPVLEFFRTDWSRREFGRIYWARYFAAPDGLDYDDKEFSHWYDRLARWVRKNGLKRGSGVLEPYFLPDALALAAAR